MTQRATPDMHGDLLQAHSLGEFFRRLVASFRTETEPRPDGDPKGKPFAGQIREAWSRTNPILRDTEALPIEETPPYPLPTISRALHTTAFSNPDSVYGYDVSHHQGFVDHRLMYDYPFVIIKSSEGGMDPKRRKQGYTDPRFWENWRNAERAGKIRSCYHFARVGKWSSDGLQGAEADGVNEADWMLEHYGKTLRPGLLPPVLDIEWDKKATAAGVTTKEVVAFCSAFVARVKDVLGIWPIVYTGPNFWRYRLERTMELSQCPLWIVSGYTGRKIPTRTIPGWDWIIHQHTNNAPRPDAPGRGMDANFFRGGMAELRALAQIPENVLIQGK